MFFKGEFMWHLIVHSAISLYNLKSQPIVVGRGGGTVTLFNEFFNGHFILCLKVNIAVSLKNLKLQAIEVGGGGFAENPSHPL